MRRTSFLIIFLSGGFWLQLDSSSDWGRRPFTDPEIYGTRAPFLGDSSDPWVILLGEGGASVASPWRQPNVTWDLPGNNP
jgi:hypothetical protein